MLDVTITAVGGDVERYSTFTVEWNARTPREVVLVNGICAARKIPIISTVAPRFDFRLGLSSAVIEVRAWPWGTVRRFALTIDGQTVYREGRRVSNSAG